MNSNKTPRICNYKYGSVACIEPCHKTKGSRCEAKCLKHLNARAKKSRQRLIIKNKTHETYPEKKLKLNINQRLSMVKCRKQRKISIEAIENTNARRIATSLSKIMENEDYVIIEDVVSSTFDVYKAEFKGKSEYITFGQERPYKRSMQELTDPKEAIPDVLEALKVVFSECDRVVVKLIKSEKGDIQQIIHTDYELYKKPLRTLSHYHYSAIISVQDGTKLMVGKVENCQQIIIPLHSMLFFRGDMPHAGAGYEIANSRLFMSVTSANFPLSKNISVVLKKKKKII